MFKTKTLKRIFFTQIILFLFLFLFTPIKTFAGDPPPAAKPNAYGCVSGSLKEYCMLAPLPIPNATGQIDPTGKIDVSSGIAPFVNALIRLFIGLTAVLAVFMIVISGMKYMATVAIGEKDAAKKEIYSAIGGLILAVSSYAILNTINPALVNLKVTLPNINFSATSSQVH